MQQTLGHVVAGCPVHLDERRYNWRHDSVLLNIMKLIPGSVRLKEYADIEDKNVRFSNPSVITGDTYRPNIVLVKDELLVIVELTVGFENGCYLSLELLSPNKDQLSLTIEITKSIMRMFSKMIFNRSYNG